MPNLLDIENPNRVGIYDSSGQFYTVERDELDIAIQQGYRLAAPNEVAKEREKLIYGEKDIQAGVLGAARGLSLGLSDVALTKTGLYEPEELRKIEQHNPTASTVGEIGGVVGSFALGGIGAVGKGAQVAKAATTATNAGKLAKIFKGAQTATALPRVITDTTKSITAGIGNKLAREASQAALEGVVYGGGHLISKAAMEDPNLNAEYAAATLGLSALAGAAVPVGLAGVAKGTQKATEFISVIPRRANANKKPVGIQEAAETLAKEYEGSQGTAALLDDVERFLNTRGKQKIEADLGLSIKPGSKPTIKTEVEKLSDDTFNVSYKVEADFIANGVDAPQKVELFSAKRQITPNGIAFTEMKKTPEFLGEFKGLMKRLHKDVELPAFGKIGYGGKTVKTQAANISTARNFAQHYENVTARYSDIRNSAQRTGAGVTDVLGDIENRDISGKIKQRQDLTTQPDVSINFMGTIPEPDSILKKVFKKFNEKYTKIDGYVFNRLLDDEQLFSKIASNDNMARSVAKEIVETADNFNNAFKRMTDEIIGNNKGHQWERLLPDGMVGVDRFNKTGVMAVQLLDRMRTQISDMIEEGAGSYGYQAKLKQLRAFIDGAEKSIAENPKKEFSDLTNLYLQMDILKRDIGKIAKQAGRKQNVMSSDIETLNVLWGPDGRTGFYQTLRTFLEDEALFGKAASVQKSINQAWFSLLEKENFQNAPKFFVRFGKDGSDGFFDAYRANQDAFEQFFRQAQDETNPLAREYMSSWLDGVNELSSRIATTILDPDITQRIMFSGRKVFEQRFKSDPAIWDRYIKNKNLYDAFSDLNEASTVFVPFMNTNQRAATVKYVKSNVEQFLEPVTRKPRKNRPNVPGYTPDTTSFTAADIFTGLQLKEAQRIAKERGDLALGVGATTAAAGALGSVIGGIPGGVIGSAVGQVQQAKRSPELLIKRYHQVKKAADRLNRFASDTTKKAVETTGKVASTTLQASQPAFVPAAALYSANKLHQHLTNKEMEKDEDLYTTLSDILQNPSNAAERIADNLADYAGVDDEVANALAGRTMEQLVFLHGKMDAMMTRPAGLKDKPMRLSAFNRNKLNRYINALQDPMSVLSVIKAGKKPSRESLEVMQQFYPDIYQQILMVLSGNGDKKALEHVGGAGSVSIGRVQAIYAQPQQQEQQGQQGQGIATPQPLAAQRLATGRIGR